MISSQKSAAPVLAQKGTSGPLPQTEHNAPASPSTCHQPPHSGSPDQTCCIVHRLEEALQLTEAMHLSNEQKAKIAGLTKQQTERCAAAHQAHQATHAQILALLTPDQQQKLHAMSEAGPEHCATGGPGAAGGKECHSGAH